MVFSVRTIFLFIRGIDQTGRAITKPRKDMTDLQKTQADLARSSYRLLFAGAAFLSFGYMATKGLAGLLETSSRGQRIVGDFQETFGRLKRALGERIVDKFGETLISWVDKLAKLSSDPTWTNLTADLVITLGLGSIAVGATLSAVAITAAVIGKLLGVAAFFKLISAGTAATAAGAVAPALLGIVIGAVLTVAIAKIIWELLPDAYKDSMVDLEAKAQAMADITGVPVRFAQRDIAIPAGAETGIFGKVKGFTQREIIQNTQIFIDTLNTTEDLEELIALWQQIQAEKTEDAYGETDEET